MTQPHIIILIDGGVVQDIVSTGPSLNVRVIDLDNARAEGYHDEGSDFWNVSPTFTDHVDPDRYSQDILRDFMKEPL